MDALTVPLAGAAAVLVVTGGFKLARPAATAGATAGLGLPGSPTAARLLGLAEVVVGVAALTVEHPAPAWAVAALYAGFSTFVLVALRRGGMLQTCGCFGALEVPPTPAHLGFDVAATVVAAVGAVTGTPSLLSLARAAPADGIVLVVVTVIATGLAVAVLTALPLVSVRAITGSPQPVPMPAPVPLTDRRSR